VSYCTIAKSVVLWIGLYLCKIYVIASAHPTTIFRCAEDLLTSIAAIEGITKNTKIDKKVNNVQY